MFADAFKLFVKPLFIKKNLNKQTNRCKIWMITKSYD